MGANKSIIKGYHSPEIEKPLGASDVVETTKDQLSGFGEGFFNQLLGMSLGKNDSPEANKKSPEKPLVVKDPQTGQIEVFKAADAKAHVSEKKRIEKPLARIEAAIDYHNDFLKSSERASHAEKREISERLNEIMIELRRLISSSKILQTEFAGVSVDQAPKDGGDYHVNFFDWLLLTIRTARQKVEDSGAWLATSKKKGGKGKWNNKQRKEWFENTSLSMSNESGGGIINQTG